MRRSVKLFVIFALPVPWKRAGKEKLTKISASGENDTPLPILPELVEWAVFFDHLARIFQRQKWGFGENAVIPPMEICGIAQEKTQRELLFSTHIQKF